MDRKGDFHIATLSNFPQRMTHGVETTGQILPAMSGDKNQAFLRIEKAESRIKLAAPCRVVTHPCRSSQEGIDNGVSGDVDIRFSNAFPKQIVTSAACRREMVFGQNARQPAICLLGPRSQHVTGPKTGLDVPDFDLSIVRGQSRGKRGRRVSLHQNQIRSGLAQYGVEANQRSARHPGQRLIRRHDVKIVVGTNAEKIEHRVEHLTMLCRNADFRLDPRFVPQYTDQRCHFYRFWSGSKDNQGPH